MSHMDDLYQKAIRAAWDRKDQADAKKGNASNVIPISAGKTKLKTVVFGYAEGNRDEKGPFLKKPFHTWSDANKAVSEMAFYASSTGYDKTDFTITWTNGDTYKGTISIGHKMTSGRPLTDHVVSNLEFLSGKKPPHLTDESYKRLTKQLEPETIAEATKMLATYDLGQKAEIATPRKPSGPTLHEQIKAEDERKKAAVKAKFDKYPPAVTDRNAAIEAIKKALQKRSSKMWSVTGGKGTSWGWIYISSPPKRQVDGLMSEADGKELAALLGLEKPVYQHESVPASSKHRTEYVDRAEGREPRTYGEQYWD